MADSNSWDEWVDDMAALEADDDDEDIDDDEGYDDELAEATVRVRDNRDGGGRRYTGGRRGGRRGSMVSTVKKGAYRPKPSGKVYATAATPTGNLRVAMPKDIVDRSVGKQLRTIEDHNREQSAAINELAARLTRTEQAMNKRFEQAVLVSMAVIALPPVAKLIQRALDPNPNHNNNT